MVRFCIVLVVYRSITMWKETMMEVMVMGGGHGREWDEWFVILVTSIFVRGCYSQYTNFWVWTIRNQWLWAPRSMSMLWRKGVLLEYLTHWAHDAAISGWTAGVGKRLVVEVVVIAVFVGNDCRAGKGE